MGIKRVLLWLFVIDLGIAFGAGLYEARVVVPAWAGIPPAAWPNTGLMFWLYVTTIPLTVLVVANGIGAWRERGPARPWWLAAAGVIVVERIATFAYFIPSMVAMAASDLPRAEVSQALSEWLLFNHVRHLLTFTGWLLAVKSLIRLDRP